MGSENILINQQYIADNLGNNDSTVQILKSMFENAFIVSGIEQIYTRDVSTDAIWDADNWDEAYWEGSYDNPVVLSRAVNYNNRYYDIFTTTASMDSSATSSGVWVKDGTITLTAGSVKTAQSTPIHYNLENIPAATLSVEGTRTDYAVYYMTSDGGTNWVTATPGERTTFSTIGQSLKYRVLNDGTTAVILTKMIINYET